MYDVETNKSRSGSRTLCPLSYVRTYSGIVRMCNWLPHALWDLIPLLLLYISAYRRASLPSWKQLGMVISLLCRHWLSSMVGMCCIETRYSVLRSYCSSCPNMAERFVSNNLCNTEGRPVSVDFVMVDESHLTRHVSYRVVATFYADVTKRILI